MGMSRDGALITSLPAQWCNSYLNVLFICQAKLAGNYDLPFLLYNKGWGQREPPSV